MSQHIWEYFLFDLAYTNIYKQLKLRLINEVHSFDNDSEEGCLTHHIRISHRYSAE